MSSERVIYPVFELSGPPCKKEGCTGVLVDTIHLRSQDFFLRCSVCGHEEGHTQAAVKVAEAVAVIERLLHQAPDTGSPGVESGHEE